MSNSTFVKGMVACVAVMLAFGGAISLLNAGNNRPEGVAEDWLTAVGDTVRGVSKTTPANAPRKLGRCRWPTRTRAAQPRSQDGVPRP